MALRDLRVRFNLHLTNLRTKDIKTYNDDRALRESIQEKIDQANLSSVGAIELRHWLATQYGNDRRRFPAEIKVQDPQWQVFGGDVVHSEAGATA